MKRKRKQRTRRRRWPFWVCSCATIVVGALAWSSWSKWIGVGRDPLVFVSLHSGSLGVLVDLKPDLDASSRWQFTAADSGRPRPGRWFPKVYTDYGHNPGALGVLLPMWMIAVPLILASAWLHWRSRRPLVGHCRCGYDLAGIEGPCPECGGER